MTEDVMGVPVAYLDVGQSRLWDVQFRFPCKRSNAEDIRRLYGNGEHALYTTAQARALADAEVARQREACALADPDDATDLEVIEHFLSTSTAATSRLRAAIERLRDCPRQFISDADRAPVRDGER